MVETKQKRATLCENERNHKKERLNSSGGGNKESVKRRKCDSQRNMDRINNYAECR